MPRACNFLRGIALYKSYYYEFQLVTDNRQDLLKFVLGLVCPSAIPVAAVVPVFDWQVVPVHVGQKFLGALVSQNPRLRARTSTSSLFKSDSRTHLCQLSFQDSLHTSSIAFRHLPPNSTRFIYAAEGALFISPQLSSDAVSSLRKVRVLI